MTPKMAMFGKKEKKAEKAPKAGARGASKQPKLPKPYVPPDIYTLLLGLSALFLFAAVVTLGLNYYWYQSTSPTVIPMSWAK